MSSVIYSNTGSSGGGSGVDALASIGSSPNANAASISGTTLTLQPASASFGGVLTTGSQSIAGAKTFLAAPILDSLTAQAMPYLNSSKQFADGKWTQADTTGLTTFTPSGTPGSAALTLNFNSMTSWSECIRHNVTLPSAVHPTYQYQAFSGGGSAYSTLMNRMGWNFNRNNNTYTIGWYETIQGSYGGKTLGIYDAGLNGVYGLWRQIEAGTSGGAHGTCVVSRASNYCIAGHFAAISPSGTSPQAYAVRAYATGENSAQQCGGYFRIYTTQTSGNETDDPATSGAVVADCGDTTNDILVLQDGGTTKVRVTDNGNTVLAEAARATDATNGFVYIPTCAGAPTGTPTSYTGTVAMVFDTSNNKLYVYDGGWIGVTLA